MECPCFWHEYLFIEVPAREHEQDDGRSLGPPHAPLDDDGLEEEDDPYDELPEEWRECTSDECRAWAEMATMAERWGAD